MLHKETNAEKYHQKWEFREAIIKLLRSPGIDSKEQIPPAYVACAGIFEQFIGA